MKMRTEQNIYKKNMYHTFEVSIIKEERQKQLKR